MQYYIDIHFHRYSQNIEELEDGLKATLTIDKTERKDSALFTCTAINDFGEDTMNIQVTVKGNYILLNIIKSLIYSKFNFYLLSAS